MNITAITVAIVELAYPVLIAASIAVARALGMIMLTPAFTRLGLTGLLRTSVAVAISIPVIFPIFQTLSEEGMPSTVIIVGILAKEIALGALIGLAFGVPFWAAEVAGELIDLQRGATMLQLLDPLSAVETSVTATLLTLMLLTLFFASGGFLLLLEGFYRSYELWPAASFAPVLNANSFAAVLGVLDKVMSVAVIIVSPLIVAILIVDVLMALLSRLAPQFHVFDLSIAVKNLLVALLMVLYLSFLLPLLLHEIGSLKGNFEVLRIFAQGSSNL